MVVPANRVPANRAGLDALAERYSKTIYIGPTADSKTNAVWVKHGLFHDPNTESGREALELIHTPRARANFLYEDMRGLNVETFIEHIGVDSMLYELYDECRIPPPKVAILNDRQGGERAYSFAISIPG